MIFVTVGNATQGFQRLLNAVGDCLEKGVFVGKEVFVQTGNNPGFKSQHCQSKPFLSMDEFQESMEKADLIITHGGCGTILQAIRMGKVPVVMPRRKEHSEIINDHQLQLVHALTVEGRPLPRTSGNNILSEGRPPAEDSSHHILFEGRIVPAYEPGDLPGAIAEARKRASQPVSQTPPPMLALVEKAIIDLLHK